MKERSKCSAELDSRLIFVCYIFIIFSFKLAIKYSITNMCAINKTQKKTSPTKEIEPLRLIEPPRDKQDGEKYVPKM